MSRPSFLALKSGKRLRMRCWSSVLWGRESCSTPSCSSRVEYSFTRLASIKTGALTSSSLASSMHAGNSANAMPLLILSSGFFLSFDYSNDDARVVVSTAAFHARVRGSVPGLGGFKETKMFLPHPCVKVSIVGSLRDREVACSASDRQGSNFESCVWRTVSSQSSHHPQEVLLAQFSLYVHKGGLKPDSFHFCSTPSCSSRVEYSFTRLASIKTGALTSSSLASLIHACNSANAMPLMILSSGFFLSFDYSNDAALL